VRAAHDPAARSNREIKLLALIGIGSVPAVVAGALLQGFFEGLFDVPRVAAAMLLVTGALLVAAEVYDRRHPTRDDVSPSGALFVGCAQALAIVPGISRSGATIAAGQFLGLSRYQATRFSFLLAVPVTAAAALLRVPDAVASGPGAVGILPMIVGFVAAFLSGYWAIGWLLQFVRRAPLLAFALYTFSFGLAALILLR
jgi:undecaprenyl-diphosphatase